MGFQARGKKPKNKEEMVVVEKMVKDVPPPSARYAPCCADINIKTKGQLWEIIDEPCYKACRDLFNKNIITTASACNRDKDSAYIVINYEAMDKNNQKIADELIKNNHPCFKLLTKEEIDLFAFYDILKIYFSVSPDDLVCDVEKKFLGLTALLQQQEKQDFQIDYEAHNRRIKALAHSKIKQKKK